MHVEHAADAGEAAAVTDDSIIGSAVELESVAVVGRCGLGCPERVEHFDADEFAAAERLVEAEQVRRGGEAAACGAALDDVLEEIVDPARFAIRADFV